MLGCADLVPRVDALSAAVLADIGFKLATTDNAVYAIDVSPSGVLELVPATWWEVTGGASPSSWLYQLDLAGPSSSTTIRRPRDGVFHVALPANPRTPWCGMSPIAHASATGKLHAVLERALGHEAGFETAQVIPMAEGSSDADDAFRQKFTEGATVLPETQAGGQGEKSGAPMTDWKANRFGPTFTEAETRLREQVEVSVCALYGISPPLFSAQSDGAAAREALRRMVLVTGNLLGRLVVAEVARVLEVPTAINYDSMAAADIAQRGRAWRSFVGPTETMSPEIASRIVGVQDRPEGIT